MNTTQTFTDLIYAAESQCDKLEGYLKEHLKGSKVLAVAEGLDWDNPKELIALSVAIESVTGVGLEDNKEEGFTLKEAAKATLKVIGKAIWMLIKGIVTLIGIILKALGSLLMKVGEIDKWVASTSVKVKKKTEEVIIDTADKIQERELKKAAQESIDVEEGLISKVFKLDSLKMTLTGDDAKRARVLLGETANRTLPIDAFIEFAWNAIDESIPVGVWFNDQKEVIELYFDSIIKHSGIVADALSQSIKTGKLGKLSDTVPKLIESVNNATETYLSQNAIEKGQGIAASGHLGVLIKGESYYQEDTIEIPGIYTGLWTGSSRANFNIEKVIDKVDNKPVKIQGSKKEYNAKTYAALGHSLAGTITKDINESLTELRVFKPSIAKETKLIENNQRLIQTVSKELEKAKETAHQALYNKVLMVLNGAYQTILQLMKLINVNIKYYQKCIHYTYQYLDWLLQVWRAGSGITMGYSQEQE